jgi:hypothetical protein
MLGFLSPRMKWLLTRTLNLYFSERSTKVQTDYASLFEDLLPKSLESIRVNEAGLTDEDFSNREVYGDLNHMPPALISLIMQDEMVMYGYCGVFGKIMSCLKDGKTPYPILVDKQIQESWRDRDTKRFLEVGGRSLYALQYLIDVVEEVTQRPSEIQPLEAYKRHLPGCVNDLNFSIIRSQCYS